MGLSAAFAHADTSLAGRASLSLVSLPLTTSDELALPVTATFNSEAVPRVGKPVRLEYCPSKFEVPAPILVLALSFSVAVKP